MNRRRGGVGVATCNGFLYAVGGHDAPASNPTSSRFDCVERLLYILKYGFQEIPSLMHPTIIRDNSASFQVSHLL